jgi:hypothetical protein
MWLTGAARRSNLLVFFMGCRRICLINFSDQEKLESNAICVAANQKIEASNMLRHFPCRREKSAMYSFPISFHACLLGKESLMHSLAKDPHGPSLFQRLLRHFIHRSAPACPHCKSPAFRRLATKTSNTVLLDTYLCHACTHVEQFVRKAF